MRERMTSKPTGYSLLSYGDMISCEPRTPAFIAALQAAVTPGCAVIDLGSGPGVFAILACKFGAGSVVAIEPDETAQLVTELAEANGCADRVSVFKGLSTDYAAGGKADVIISDLHGSLPLFETHIPTIVDARRRLLKPGGTLIPWRDTLQMALVHSSKAISSYEKPWLANSLGLDLRPGHRFVSNQPTKSALDAADLLCEPVSLGIIDYQLIEEPDFSAVAEIEDYRLGTAHGFALWFDCELGPDIGFSNAPGQPTQVYGQMFFPFSQPLDLMAGGRVRIEILAKLIGGEYVWTWTSSLWRQDSTEPAASLRQSTFSAKVFSPQSLSAHSSDFVLTESLAIEVDSLCLEMLGKGQSLGDVADALFARYPQKFRSANAALNHVARLTAAYR